MTIERRFRSRTVALTLVPMVASWFAACGGSPRPTHQLVCADGSNRIVDDERCREEERRPATRGSYAPYLYHRYYMPYRAGGYPLGAPVVGATATAPAGARVSVGRVVSGGFGATAHGAGVGA